MSLLPKSRTGSLRRIIAIRLFPHYTSDVSFLFHKRTKKIVNWVWGVIAIFVSLGMVVFFAPGLVSLISG